MSAARPAKWAATVEFALGLTAFRAMAGMAFGPLRMPLLLTSVGPASRLTVHALRVVLVAVRTAGGLSLAGMSRLMLLLASVAVLALLPVVAAIRLNGRPVAAV